MSATLICPKCRGGMRSYERSGVTIDQCEECRGVFLDRGELERLMDAEEQRYPTPPDSRYQSGYEKDHSDSGHGFKHDSKRRRGGFLGELFD